MTANREQTSADINAELIKLAYSMAVEPQKLHLMQTLMDQQLEGLYKAGDNDNELPSGNPFSDIEVHFQNALALMERQGRSVKNSSVATRIIDMDSQPAALINTRGVVEHANTVAQSEYGIAENVMIPAGIFDIGGHKKFIKALRSMDNAGHEQFIGIYPLLSMDGEKPLKFVLSKTYNYKGETVGRISMLRARWQEHTGRQFQKSLELTPTELVITKAFVTGESLSALAKKRGRTLGTVRNQAKKLLAKLEIGSKTELACLYHGFAQITSASIDKDMNARAGETAREYFTFQRSDGSNLSYEIYGAPSAKPVLFLHALLCGTGLTSEIKDLVRAHKIKLIMPWRPFHKDTEDFGSIKTAPERFAADLIVLLDHLGIERTQVLCADTGAVYGYALAQAAPERVGSMVMAGGAIPLTTPAQFKAMSAQQRIPHYIAKHAPRILRAYIRSIMSKLDAGYDEEYGANFFDSSPADLATILGSEMKPLIREAMSHAFAQGHKAIGIDLQVTAHNWEHLLEGIDHKVALMSGAQDAEYAPSTLETFVKDKPNFTLKVMKDAGNLVFFQRPKEIFAQLMELPE